MYVCIYIYIYIHAYIHTYIYRPDTERIRGLLRTWDFDSVHGEEEYTEFELFERLREENVTPDEIAFIFKGYDFCTRLCVCC